MIVGSPGDSTAASQSGRAYVFSASGSLLATTHNPVPAANARFGEGIEAYGANALISASGSAVIRLMNPLTGSLIRTFTSPSPSSSIIFGEQIRVSGNRVLAGCPVYSAFLATPAYVFNGLDTTLMTTLNEPAGGAGRFHGSGVAWAGNLCVVGNSSQNSGFGRIYIYQGPPNPEDPVVTAAQGWENYEKASPMEGRR